MKMDKQKYPRMYGILFGLGIVFLFVACLGGGLFFFGYARIDKLLAGAGIVFGNLCIVAFWVLKSIRKKETRK
jgi:hypothetical protein